MTEYDKKVKFGFLKSRKTLWEMEKMYFLPLPQIPSFSGWS